MIFLIFFYKVVSVYRRATEEGLPARSLRNPDLLYVEVNKSHLPSGLTIEEQDGQVLLQWEQALLAETYNVYRNGELVAEGVTELQYVEAVEGVPSFYQVTGVLNAVESSPSNKVYYANYSVNESNESFVKVFPNPAKQSVTVEAEDIKEVVVYDLTGQQLLRRAGSGDNWNVDLSNLNAGVYYFQIKTGRGCQIQKIVLVK